MVRLYRARTRTRPTRKRTRTQVLISFVIQMEHEFERGKPSAGLEAARFFYVFLAVRDKIWFNLYKRADISLFFGRFYLVRVP